MAFNPLAVVDDRRRYVDVNPPAADMLGAPARDIVGRRIDDFTAPEQREGLEEIWRCLQRDGTAGGPYEILRRDGMRRQIEFRAMRDFAPGRHLIVARGLLSALPGVSPPDRRAPGPRLTPRELEVLQLAADGGSARAIAEVLVISPGTVKTHFEHVYAKLRVCDRAAAVAEGLRRGLIR
jgi:PAS domain S-box-containing protein